MARTYTKGKRAEQEAETRQRIVEATLGLHTEAFLEMSSWGSSQITTSLQ